jgi:hypothetical protein
VLSIGACEFIYNLLRFNLILIVLSIYTQTHLLCMDLRNTGRYA